MLLHNFVNIGGAVDIQFDFIEESTFLVQLDRYTSTAKHLLPFLYCRDLLLYLLVSDLDQLLLGMLAMKFSDFLCQRGLLIY